MKEIRNKTSRPIKIPLPGGKKLFVGPGHVAQIADNAVDDPHVQQLVEDGSIEILGSGERHLADSPDSAGREQTHGNIKTVRRSRGDR
jgi:hypothetical protein